MIIKFNTNSPGKDLAYSLFMMWCHFCKPDWDNEHAGRYWDNQFWRWTNSEFLIQKFMEVIKAIEFKESYTKEDLVLWEYFKFWLYKLN